MRNQHFRTLWNEVDRKLMQYRTLKSNVACGHGKAWIQRARRLCPASYIDSINPSIWHPPNFHCLADNFVFRTTIVVLSKRSCSQTMSAHPAHPLHTFKRYTPDDFTCNVLPPGLLVIHYAGRCSENNVSKLTRWQKLYNPLLEVANFDVVSRADDTGLVDAEERYGHSVGRLRTRDVFTVH